MQTKRDYMQPFGLRMPASVRDWVNERAVEQERSINWIIVKILEDAMAAATEGQIGVGSPAAASSNNAALAGGASITNGS